MAAGSRFRQLVLLAGCTLATAYFAYHAYSGRHGLAARLRISAELTQSEAKLRDLLLVKAAFERDVALLQADRLDPDLLEETARTLGFAHADDLIVLQR